MAIRVLTDTIGEYPSLLDPTRIPVDVTLQSEVGVDHFQTKTDLETKSYTSVEEKLGVRIHIGQPIGWSSYVDVNGVLSQGSKAIENPVYNNNTAAFNRFGGEVGAGQVYTFIDNKIRLAFPLGAYVEAGYMTGSMPLGLGENSKMETPLYYSGVGLNSGIDVTLKGKKVDFGIGLNAKLGIRGVGLQNGSPSGISRSVIGQSWGVGLRFSIKPHVIPFHPTENNLAEASTTPTSGGDYRVIGFVGDQQYHRVWRSGIIRSLTVNTHTPALRAPGVNGFISQGHETLVRESMPSEYRNYEYLGLISTGDATDIAGDEELDAFFHTQNELVKADPRNRILAYLIGNHEVFHSGVVRSGHSYFGLIGALLNLQSKERSYEKDIHGTEVGGVENRLTKKKLIEQIYYNFYSHPPNPTTLTGYTAGSYQANKGRWVSWKKTDQVYQDFWKQESDGTYNALVSYREGEMVDSVKEFMYCSALKMDEFNTPKGVVPLYFINIDSMDYMQVTTNFGAVQGTVSSIQVKVVWAFIKAMLKLNPRAKFILGSHYPVTSIYNGSLLGPLLSHESVIAFMGAHTHERGYINLNSEKYAIQYNIHRRTPLPQITVSSIADNYEMGWMKFGFDSQNPERLVLEFNYRNLYDFDPPGDDPMVDNEISGLYNDLNPHPRAKEHFDDKEITALVDLDATISKQIRLALALIAKPGKVHDLIVTEDTIPTMVSDTQTFVRLFASVIKMSLSESPDPRLASQMRLFEEDVLDYLDVLAQYYHAIWQRKRGDEIDFINTYQLNDYEEKFNKRIQTIVALIRENTGIMDEHANCNGSHSHNQILETTNDPNLKMQAALLPILTNYQHYISYYRHWIENYDALIRSNHRSTNLINEANLFNNNDFHDLLGHLSDYPYGTRAYAFMSHAFQASVDAYMNYYKGKVTTKQRESGLYTKQEVQNTVRIEVDIGSGQIYHSPILDEKSPQFGDGPHPHFIPSPF